jgi:hypothetical protein
MQAAFLNALIKADTMILRTFIWHSSYLRFVFWSGQEAASVIPVTEWPYLWAAIRGAEKRQPDVTGNARGPLMQEGDERVCFAVSLSRCLPNA